MTGTEESAAVRRRARDAILGGFVADAAALGLHWIYDQAEVRERAGDDPAFRDPAANKYHARRGVGDFTHYGDHALVALASLVEREGLDGADYTRRYTERFGAEDYDGYIDHATKDLLASGKGADDNQAGAFVKLAVVVARYLEDPEFDARVEAAIRVTHDNTQAVRYGLAAACAIRAAIRGSSAAEAVDAACAPSRSIGASLEKLRSADGDLPAFALATGQTCPVPNAFPVALHAALHDGSFESVVRQSILSGGDTSGRLFVTAAIRGATDGVPAGWVAKLNDREDIERLTDALLDEALLTPA